MTVWKYHEIPISIPDSLHLMTHHLIMSSTSPIAFVLKGDCSVDHPCKKFEYAVCTSCADGLSIGDCGGLDWVAGPWVAATKS